MKEKELVLTNLQYEYTDIDYFNVNHNETERKKATYPTFKAGFVEYIRKTSPIWRFNSTVWNHTRFSITGRKTTLSHNKISYGANT